MAIIDIKNLTFRYKNKFVFDNFNLSVEKGNWVTIAGSNGAGKTTLVKILAGLEKNYADIKILDKSLNKKNEFDIKKEIGFVFDNPDNFFACETVEDELAFSLENLATMPSTIKAKIKEISKLLKIEDILKENPYELSGGEKQKVALACALMLEPRILILDEALQMIDINERKEIFEILKRYVKEKRVTILSLTYNMEECLYSDRVIILNEGKILLDGSFPGIFEHENIIRKIGIEVPFEVEFSQKLKLFNLVDGLDLDLESLVNKLCK